MEKLKRSLAPNRVAVYLTSIAALAAGLAPAVAELDLTSTAGILVGLLGVVKVVDKWLDGWQSYESDQRYAELEQAKAAGDSSTVARVTKAK